MPAAPHKSGLLPTISTVGFLILALPVAFAIGTALIMTAAAAFETIKFVHCTEQMLGIISTAQSDASKEATFGQSPNEDIIDNLIRRGQMVTAQPLHNNWGGNLRVVASPAGIMRMETDVPSRACRRLAVFFTKNAKDLKLVRMETRSDESSWQQFYTSSVPTGPEYIPTLNTACGKSEHMMLALSFQFR